MQTSIDQYFKSRKRPAIDSGNEHNSKIIARKLFGDTECTTAGIDKPNLKACKRANLNLMKTLNSADKNGILSNETHLLRQKEVTTENYKTDDVSDLEHNSNNSQSVLPKNECVTPEISPAKELKLKKELGLGEFNQLLKKSKNLELLKESLQSYQRNKDKLRDIFRRKRELLNKNVSEHEPIEFEVPTSPMKHKSLTPRKLAFTDIAASPKKNETYVSPRKLLDEGPSRSPIKPAYERYNHLIASGKDPLILPYKYSSLKEVFHCVDTVMKMVMVRGDVVTYSKLKVDVQRMLNRNFTQHHLGQIKAIYPDSYEFSQELIKASFGNTEKYELVIKLGGMSVSDLNSHEVLKREKVFHQALLNHTKMLHKEFLESLDPPIIVNINQLTRWHPLFDIDNVPDVEPVPLPQPPIEQKITTVKAFLEKAKKNNLYCNNKMARMINEMDQNEEKKKVASTEGSLFAASDLQSFQNEAAEEKSVNKKCFGASPIPALQNALRGIPKSLIEKIRAKQAAKMSASLTQTSADRKLDVMKSRLPEIARISRNIFVTEKKSVLAQDMLLLKLSHSYKEHLTTKELLEHLHLISEHVPGWINFYTMRNSTYVKLLKDADISRIIGKLQLLVPKIQ